MPWKINKIRIENFKYFLNPFELKPEGKNVLMYGENGSGKSSIYWAVYTHFQSSLKRPTADDAGKYFQVGHEENLRNLYDDGSRRSGIELEFVNESQVIKGYTDGSWQINTHSDTFMKETTFASDFMNYKFLSALFDFKNSKKVNLFPIFKEEIFPFVSLSGQCFGLDGQPLGESGADFWWNFIQKCYHTEGMLNKRSAQGGVFVHDAVYSTYQNLIKDFNDKLRILLRDISRTANEKLREFNMPVSVKLELIPCAFDKKVLGKTRSYDGLFYNPEIILSAHLLRPDGSPVSATDIVHPRSFFNEAKLTRMALALRLAIFDRKYQSPDCAQVIMVDDLLISLDMSNRLLVVQKLLEYSDRYQLFIFTHDMAFYELVRDTISQRNDASKWKKYEMYAIDEGVSESRAPEPWVKEKKDFLQQARASFSNYEYQNAANNLRKECERQLQRLYPKNWVICQKADGTSSMNNLNALDQNLEQFYERFGIVNTPTPNIDQYRKRILNPASHNDSRAKVFRSEIIIAIDEIAKFQNIAINDIIGIDDISTRTFIIEVNKAGASVSVEFTANELWRKLSYEGTDYWEDIDVHVKAASAVGIRLNEDDRSIRSLWKALCRYAGYPEDTYPLMEECIKSKSDGTLLKDI